MKRFHSFSWDADRGPSPRVGNLLTEAVAARVGELADRNEAAVMLVDVKKGEVGYATPEDIVDDLKAYGFTDAEIAKAIEPQEPRTFTVAAVDDGSRSVKRITSIVGLRLGPSLSERAGAR